MVIDVSWVKLPKTKFEQLKNGTKGVVFRLSPQYVAKILYSTKGPEENPDYSLRENHGAVKELDYECEINHKLFEAGIGNVPRPMGIERLRLYDTAYPAFIMEYLQIPRADELGFVDLGKAKELAKQEFGKAIDIGLLPGRDALNPGNYFYDPKSSLVRLIDFGRWEYDPDFVPESV